MGAALQGGKLAAGNGMVVSSAAQNVILMDVTPLSLSIETVGGVATKIIDRNTTIPTRHSQIFSTAAPFQTAVDIKVLQGERYYARDNKLLGNFRLKGIRRAMAGVPQIEVTFDIDANGILTVSAKDKGTGKEQSITIDESGRMSDEEIDRAIRDAETYAAQDATRRDAMEVHAEAARLVQEVDAALAKSGKQLEKEEKKQVKADSNALRKLLSKKTEKLEETDIAAIRSAKEQLDR